MNSAVSSGLRRFLRAMNAAMRYYVESSEHPWILAPDDRVEVPTGVQTDDGETPTAGRTHENPAVVVLHRGEQSREALRWALAQAVKTGDTVEATMAWLDEHGAVRQPGQLIGA